MPNQLIHETSPYLLQHAHNPVDWYPWGLEALRKARDENKPIFLSIGYAACHWCHVMAHESFEDPAVAKLLNDSFVSIKVDREERPDLDSIYMTAVVAMTGQGGWPMSVFLTPNGEPFYGGTYFPPTRRYGMPSFREVLESIARSWKEETGEIRKVSQDLVQHLREQSAWNAGAPAGELSSDMLREAAQSLVSSYDWEQGGWGKAPRFPQPMAIEFLLMQSGRDMTRAREAAAHALHVMSRGGLYDVIGGGFHRYSTDDRWLVPHFEKMLYDNAQLALAYLHGHLLTGSPAFLQVCTETLDFILREMTHPAGGFYSSLDADSEGEEGKYYVWSAEEIEAALPDPADRELVHTVYTLPPGGNFEGRIILQRVDDLDVLSGQMGITDSDLIARLAQAHSRLYAARERRVRPGTDDKVLVMWNALALRAFAQAARYLRREDYLTAARRSADFILREMYHDGRLLRAWRDGQAGSHAFLEDHVGLILGLLDLYQSDPDPRWYQSARRLAEDMFALYADEEGGGFFDSPADQKELIVRPKEIQDNATPSGNALAALALLQLAAYDENAAWHDTAVRMASSVAQYMLRYPTAFAMWLQAADFAVGPVRQVAVIADEPEAAGPLLREIWSTYRPRTVVAAARPGSEAQPSLLQGRGMIQGRPTAYVCQGFTCKLPVNSVEGLIAQLA